MKSRTPKALHTIAGRSMLAWIGHALAETPVDFSAVVVSPDFPPQSNGSSSGMKRVVQPDPLGTGHALLRTEPLLRDRSDHLLVLNADMPLITGKTLNRIMDRHLDSEATLTVLTCRVESPGSMGRVVRDSGGRITRVVESRDAGPETLASNEVCCGAYCFRADWLWSALRELQPAPNGEFYITSLIENASRNGGHVEDVSPDDPTEALGVNDRTDLAHVTAVAFDRTRRRLMAGGVTLVDPASAFVDADVQVGMDTTLQPGVILQGSTRVGEDCHIGPNAVIKDSTIGNGSRIQGSVIEESEIGDEVHVGPYCHLRPGTRVAHQAHIGNYVEIKQTTVGPKTRIGHFSYLGDSEIGARVNIGAGTVTCNYDGVKKNRTTIGDDAFIGSDSMLVAPVNVGARAVTGAGSVVTGDVPEDGLVFGVPAKEKPRREDR